MTESKGYTAITLILGMLALATWVLADPGEGINLGPAVFSPYAELNAMHDSNVQVQPDDEDDDISVNLKVGSGILLDGGKVGLQADIWGSLERYSDQTDEDHEDFGESLGLELLDRDSILIGIRESYENVDELDYGTGSIEAREVLDARATLGRNLTEKAVLDIGYSYGATEYESTRLFDWNERVADFELSHALTDKTAAMLIAESGSQDSDGNDEDGDYFAVRIGVKSRQTERITARVGVGIVEHESDEDLSIVSFEVGVDWQITDRVSLNMNGDNGVEPAPQDENNYKITTTAGLGAKWQLVDEFSAGLDVRYVNNVIDRDVTIDGALEEKEDDIVSGMLTVTYTPPTQALEVFLSGKYEDKDSTIAANDYSQMQVILGAKLTY